MSRFENPTDPTFLGPTLKKFGTSENFSIFRVHVFRMIFMFFVCKKKKIKKNFSCLRTDPKEY